LEPKIKACFVKALMIDESKIDVEKLEYQAIPEWDSVGHMALIANLEDEFNVMFDMEDVISLSSYSEAVKLVGKYLKA